MKDLMKKTTYLESFLPPSPWARTNPHRLSHRVPLCQTWLEVNNGCNMGVADRRGSQKRGAVNYYRNEIDFLAVPLYTLTPSRATA